MTKITKKWALATATVLQHSAEGLLNTKEGGFTTLLTQQSAATATGITAVGLVKALGTAGTGTAISSLSGAAAKSALLAWFGGGSMLIGSVVTLPALAFAGGWLALLMLKGRERKEKDLTKTEQGILSRCLVFSALLKDKTHGKVSKLKLTPKNVDALRQLSADMEKYLRHGCRKSRHVRNRTVKNHEELSKLLDELR